jgi:hypothetical protein
MGAHLFYKTKLKTLSESNRANDFLKKDKFNMFLTKNNQCAFTISGQENLDWAENEQNSEYWLNYFRDKIGRGEFKVSGLDEDNLILDPRNLGSFFELSTKMFERLNRCVEMKYLSSSCAFSGDYYTDSQISRITQKGKLLSGGDKEKIQARLIF